MSPRVSFTVWQPGCNGVWGRQGSKEGVSPKWAGGGIRIGDHLHSGDAREAGVKHAKKCCSSRLRKQEERQLLWGKAELMKPGC